MPQKPRFESGDAELEQLACDHPDVADAARSLARDGFATVDFDFDPAVLDEAEAFTREGLGTSARIHDAWLKNNGVRQLAVSAPVLLLLRKLYGREPIPFQTLNFKYGSQQRTHADTFHFNSVPERFMCGVWIALEDIGEDAGPLHYYPGSHHLPVFESPDLPGARDYAAYEDFVAEIMTAKGFERKTARLKRGQAFIWSANLFHGGSKRLNPDATRLSQVSHYFFDGCAYYTPADSDPANGSYFVRELYDIARKRFVGSDLAQLPARASLRTKLARRLNVALRRAPKS